MINTCSTLYYAFAVCLLHIGTVISHGLILEVHCKYYTSINKSQTRLFQISDKDVKCKL